MVNLKSMVRNVAQPKRSQAYYDSLAKELKEGMLAYNPKTNITTYSRGTQTTVIKGKWDNTRLNLGKFNVINKFNPNPSVPEIVGKDNIITSINNTSIPFNTNNTSSFNYKRKPLNILV